MIIVTAQCPRCTPVCYDRTSKSPEDNNRAVSRNWCHLWLLAWYTITHVTVHINIFSLTKWFLTSRDKCPESYCHNTRQIGPRAQNFNVSHNFSTSIDRAWYFTCAFLVTRPFTPFHKFWPSNLEVWPLFKKFHLDRSLITGRERDYTREFLFKATAF